MPAPRLACALLLALTLAACRPAGHDSAAPRPEAPLSTDTLAAPESGAEPGADPSNVIRRYYAALDARDYRLAYTLWGDGGPPGGVSFEAFADGFEGTASTSVELGTARVEGAAGSLYAIVPVTVRARTTDGVAQRFTGTYTLRRVNDVPGATAAQRRWHLRAADLRPAR